MKRGIVLVPGDRHPWVSTLAAVTVTSLALSITGASTWDAFCYILTLIFLSTNCPSLFDSLVSLRCASYVSFVINF